MMVFYQCFGRSHTSIVAAHLHLGRLSPATVPTVNQLSHLPFFDKAGGKDMGVPLLLGRDDEGHDIYAIGLGLAALPALGAICSICRLSAQDGEPLVVGTLAGLGMMARIGGGLSRQLGLVFIGRPMVAQGVRLIFPRLVQTVASVKRYLAEITKVPD